MSTTSVKRSNDNSNKTQFLSACSPAALAFAVAVVAVGSAQAQEAAPALPTAPAAAAPAQVGEIIVTGSRIATSGFNTPSPVTVVGADAIQQMGAIDVAQVLAEVPAFRPTRTATTFGAGSAGNTGSQTLDLRGLGDTRTLVLLDGRRFVPSSVQGTVDLNMIPTMLIDRIEVVSGGASAAYGSDAVAGVANIILNKKLTGVRASVQYGKAEAGDNRTYAASLAVGGDWWGGRAHTVAAYEFSDNNGAGNCYTRDWCAGETFNFTNPDYGTGPGKNGLPARVILSDAHMATMTPGGIINAGPLKGTAFNAAGQPFQYSYGVLPGTFFMAGGDGKGTNPYIAGPLLKVPIQRNVFFSHSDLDLGSGITGTIDASLGRVVAVSRGNPPNDSDLVLKIDNPYLPASVATQMQALGLQSVTFGRQGDEDWGFSETKGVSTTGRLVAALKGSFDSNWKWDVYYQYGQNKYTQSTSNNRQSARWLQAFDTVRDQYGNIVCRSSIANPNNGCQPLDLIGTGNISQAAKDWIGGTAVNETKISQNVAAANVTGSLFHLPGGDFAVAGGGEFRRDTVDVTADAISQAGGWFLGNNPGGSGSVNVFEGYVEGVAPLVKDVFLAKSLELNGAVRVTNYSTSGTVATWKAGGVWEPVEQLKVRVTRSRDIRAPNVNELFGGSTTNASTRVFDRLTQLDWLATGVTGSNPDLKPEKADTWTVGFVVQPTWGILRRLRLSADFYDIKVRDAVTQIGAQQILDRCSEGAQDLCALVTFDPGPSHRPLVIHNPWLNLAELHAEGVDLEGAYTQPTSFGDFRLRVLATYAKHLSTTDSLGTIDRAGQTGLTTGAIPGVPKWTVNTSVTYARGPFSMNVESRYIAKGTYNATEVGPEDPGYDVNLPNSAQTNRVGARTYYDLGMRYMFKMEHNRSVELFGSIDNVTDRDPPLAVQNAVATNPILFDTIGRSYNIGLRFVY